MEVYLEGLGDSWPTETLGGLAEDLKAVLARHLEAERVYLLTGRDAGGRIWLRVVAVLRGTRPPGEGGSTPART
ncbi:hypothetical protein [Thermus sediminis]|uniref:hypothetical protein n=1 Tax=Thermus sediminis TaxID=1761908 RepID=UPI0013008DF4|nr:hypothetical protein [Thermus sediminis]